MVYYVGAELTISVVSSRLRPDLTELKNEFTAVRSYATFLTSQRA